MPFSNLPQEVRDALPGVLGSLTAIPFMKGGLPLRLAKGFGGAVLAYYASAPLATHVLHRLDLQGLAGFLLGLIGMSLVQKAFDALEAFGAPEVGRAATDWVLRRLGVKQ